MRRPQEPRAKARVATRLLIGSGVEQVALAQYGNSLTIGGRLPVRLSVSGRTLPHKMTPSALLEQMRRDDPDRVQVLLRCIDPEMERALVEVSLEDWAQQMRLAQRGAELDG